MRDLQVGDTVQFQLAPSLDRPRHTLSLMPQNSILLNFTDNGPNGPWVNGIVTKLVKDFFYGQLIVIEHPVIVNNFLQYYNVPLESNHPEFYKRAGFPTLKLNSNMTWREELVSIPDQTVVPACDCGCDKCFGQSNNVHSDWCSKKKYLDEHK